jgi:hypothetical protein
MDTNIVACVGRKARPSSVGRRSGCVRFAAPGPDGSNCAAWTPEQTEAIFRRFQSHFGVPIAGQQLIEPALLWPLTMAVSVLVR